MSRRHFESANHAVIYAQNRPGYSREVFDTILKYCQDGGGKSQLAVDAGCGTGHQSTLDLLSHFKKVIGVDISEAQLNQAPRDVPNLEFKQSPSECMPFLKSGSVDLILAACAFHWFDVQEFFQEVERVLTPCGCLAVCGYRFPSLPEPEGKQILDQFFSSHLREFVSDCHAMPLDGYRSVDLPFPDSQRSLIECPMNWTVDQLCDFLSSLSLWQCRLKIFPNSDGLEILSRKLLDFYKRHTGDDIPRLQVIFPVTLLLGRKPRI